MTFTNLGDWCKWLEKNFSPDLMIPTLPVIIRLDGCNFHHWTKGLDRPFDLRLKQLMVDTTKFLVKETNAVIGYTQSDEITLILYSDKKESTIYHDGKKQKILSKLTAKCVNFFNQRRLELLPNHDKIATFDCRIYQTPTLEDACSQLLWREIDATKNSIYSLARHYFSHKVCLGKHSKELQELLFKHKDINWNDLPPKLKRGTYIQKRLKIKSYTPEEILLLPEKHLARKNPNLGFARAYTEEIELPIFSTIKNRVGVVFYRENPNIE